MRAAVCHMRRVISGVRGNLARRVRSVAMRVNRAGVIGNCRRSRPRRIVIDRQPVRVRPVAMWINRVKVCANLAGRVGAITMWVNRAGVIADRRAGRTRRVVIYRQSTGKCSIAMWINRARVSGNLASGVGPITVWINRTGVVADRRRGRPRRVIVDRQPVRVRPITMRINRGFA